MMRYFKDDRIRPSLQVLVTVLLCISLFLTGCGEKVSAEELTKYDDQTILLHGLTTEDIQVSVTELKELEHVKRTEQATRFGGEVVEVKAEGALLSDLLENYGFKQTDWSTIRLTASDQYSIAVSSDLLASSEILLAYYDEGAPFSAEDGPVRVVIPGQRAMYWVRKLCRIDFEGEDGAVPAEKLVFLESAAASLGEKAAEEKEGGQVLTTQSLTDSYGPSGEEVTNVYMLAEDGLMKNETAENFLSASIQMTGQESPLFTAVHLPEGMHVKNLLTAHYGSTVFFSLGSAMDSMEVVNVDDASGILFPSVLKKIGSMSSDHYRFTDLKGQQQVFAFDDLKYALFYTGAQGQVIFQPNNPKGEIMDGLLSIEAVHEE